MSLLEDGLLQLGLELTAGQVAQLDQLEAAVLETNRHFNLTRITSHEDFEAKHVLDSLTAAIPVLDRLKAGESLRLVDVGAGAGFPGLPLKIAFPQIHVTLIEATRKKANFIRHAAEQLHLEGVTVVSERAETAGRDPSLREQFDWATGRALGALPVVVELCAPFLEPGGLLVAQRKGDLDAHLLGAARAFGALKMWTRTPIPVSLPGLEDGRGLIVGEKYGPTPQAYPRRPGMPKKEPLAS